ncbi:GH32 C-terminal domain-containing protein [Corynebacterium sp.]|uniref:GH32 C-terminal domain-containing protein n=1 Tax=Corynebacterium sp. TaxID=1720 RepID=UPI0026DD0222|nr:GH32 C-terminal domain-containing protein [Corynebacterium sp.]MDO5076494.1 GH32 C-terminal domain-containing protein [Corynebacterium sp.]
MSHASHHPELHATAEQGILNAPAGVLRSTDSWHIFHQYQPTIDAAARWAHQVSPAAPYDWVICDDVLAPVGAETKLRAGSVANDGDTVDLFFTSVTDTGCSIHVATIENITETLAEISDDALHLDEHVVRCGEVLSDQDGYTDFRSPCVVPKNDGWLMLAVTGESESPTLVIAESDDRRNWKVCGPLTFAGTTNVEQERRLVAPRIIQLRDELATDSEEVFDILIVTLERDGVDHSGYLVGTLDGTVFHVRTPFQRLDFGHDFTRPRNTNTLDHATYGRAALFGLMNGIGRYDDPTTHLSLRSEQWANCLSVPRLTTLEGGLLFQTPAFGLPAAVEQTNWARLWTGLFDASEGAVTVTLYNPDDSIAGVVRHSGDRLQFDRSMNPHHLGSPIAEAELIAADTDALTILVDGSTVEIFADGGVATMASRVYFDTHCARLEVETSGDATILQCYEVTGAEL